MARIQPAVLQALLRSKHLGPGEFARELGVSRQHVHRLLTGTRDAGTRHDDLDRLLALGEPCGDQLFYAIAELTASGELALLPTGGTQPLFELREVAEMIASQLSAAHDLDICVVPIWPSYAWEQVVAYHAAWQSTAEPSNVFVVDRPLEDRPSDALVREVEESLAYTLELRRAARDRAIVSEIAKGLNAES